MRKSYVLVFIVLCSFTFQSNAQFQTFGSWDVQGIPSYLLNPGDVVTQQLLDRIDASLPETYPVPVYHPEYLSQPLNDLKLLKSGQVWITFVGEGANFLNSIGFYTYDLNSPPLTAPQPSAIKVIFPNCSLPGSGGWLQRGSKVYLGQFPANTGIGVVLMANGFNSGNSTVTTGLNMYYSNPAFNPESDPALKRHHLFLYDTTTKNIILGFEDKHRITGGSDHDFNDVLFYLTATPPDAWDTTGIPVVSNPGNAGSGNNGGLESESLGDIVSKWRYNRIKNNYPSVIDYAKFPDFKPEGYYAKQQGNSYLEFLMPETLENGDNKKLTSPTDLLNLTKALEVISVDYINDNKAKAVVLALKTAAKVYSHTKSICDRFRGGKLLRVEPVTINGYQFSRFTLLHDNGNLEYAIAFVVGNKNSRPYYTLQTNWVLSSYAPDDTLYNFQVWGAKPHFAHKLVIDILNKLAQEKPIQQLNTNNIIPSAYMTVGRRNKQNLDIFINNTINAANAKIVFEEKVHELSNYGIIEKSFTLQPGKNNLVSFDIKDGYEYSGKLYIDNVPVDEFYMADGNWGLDYDGQYTSIIQYKPNNDFGRVYNDDLPVYRTVTLKVDTKDYISIYKSIRSGFEAADLKDYATLKFFAKGNDKVTVRLIKKSVVKFKEQYSITLNLTPEGKDYVISLEDFISSATEAIINPDDITSIVFTFEAPGGIQKSIDFFVKDVAFSKAKIVSNRSLQSKVITVYPNPVGKQIQCSFVSDNERTVTLRITDIMGRTLYTKQINAVRGNNTVNVTLDKYSPHAIGFITINGDDVKYEATKLIFK